MVEGVRVAQKPMAPWLYYVLVAGLFISNCAAWCLTLISLPGNWLIVGFAASFAWLVPASGGRGVSWPVVGVILALAVLGEVVEAMAGAVGAAQQGGSRRGIVLSLLGTIAGSVLGVMIGLPIPIVGSAVAAIVGGAAGAFAGALLGEHWKGRTLDEGVRVGTAAFWGRILGTAGKLAVGAMMIVIITVDSLW